MRRFAAVLIFFAASPALGQDHQHGASSASASSVLNYSAEERAQGLLEGRGMGLAIPAERAGYPGPRHVIELSAPLMLTPTQLRQTQALFDAMKARASELGDLLLRRESELDRLFTSREATPERLDAAARAIATAEANLKITHLRTHLAMMEILTPEQVSRYVELRRTGGGTGRTRPTEDHSH